MKWEFSRTFTTGEVFLRLACDHFTQPTTSLGSNYLFARSLHKEAKDLMDHENTTCYLILDSNCSFSAGDPGSSWPREGAGRAAAACSCSTGHILTPCSSLSSTPCSRALPEEHLPVLWLADRIQKAWSILLDAFCSGSFTLKLRTVSWSPGGFFVVVFWGVCPLLLLWLL